VRGQTVNKQGYGEVFEQMRKRVYHVRAEIANTWMLHRNIAPCHTAITMNEFFTKLDIPVVLQPPCSPDLSSCDFFLFPKLKFHLKGLHFGTVDNSVLVIFFNFLHRW
jgi:hypothetical protein